MTLRIEARPSGILVPIADFGLRDLPTRPLILGEDIALVAALNLATDGKEARLMKADAAGNLRVTLAGGSSAVIGPLALAAAVAGQLSQASGQGDNNGGTTTAAMAGYLFDGALWNRPRAASAANLAAQTGPGIQLATPPGNWSVNGNAAVGSQSTAQRAAGGAGVRHVATGWEIVISSQVAVAAAALTVNLRDGATGAGTILRQWVIQLAAAIIPPFVISTAFKSIVGSAATAMTLESSAAFASLGVSVNLDGYDAP